MDHLTARKIPITYYNLIEAFLQSYQLKEENGSNNNEFFIEQIKKLDYTLEANVFNFILNIILDIEDYKTGMRMFELAFDECLKKIDIQSIDSSKDNLKKLLKMQTDKLK